MRLAWRLSVSEAVSGRIIPENGNERHLRAQCLQETNAGMHPVPNDSLTIGNRLHVQETRATAVLIRTCAVEKCNKLSGNHRTSTTVWSFPNIRSGTCLCYLIGAPKIPSYCFYIHGIHVTALHVQFAVDSVRILTMGAFRSERA